MARVSIEERAAVGAKKLARLVGCSRSEAIGHLYWLWHDSQELEQDHCTEDDVQDWLDIRDETQRSKIVSGLVQASFLVRRGPDPSGVEQFKIRGNLKHIENLSAKREAARENGKSGGRPKESQIKLPLPRQDNNQKQADVGSETKPTSPTQPNQPDNHSSLQFSALQGSARERGSALTSEEIKSGKERCAKIWIETLRKLKAPRETLLPTEETEIVRAIHRFGDAEIVALALFGARHEPGDERFDPKKHISIARVLTKDNEGRERVDRFVNFAVAEIERERERKAKLQPRAEPVLDDVQSGEDDSDHWDQSRIQAYMAEHFPRTPSQGQEAG